MPYLKMPDGRYFEAPEGTPKEAALELARKKYPEAFDTRKPEEGFIPAMKAAGMRQLSGYGLAASGIGALDEQTARAANAKTEEQIQKHVYKPVQYEGGDDSVKGALAKYGWFNTTPGSEAPGGGVQLLKFWRDQLGGMAPQLATTMAGAYGGAKLGAMTGNPLGVGAGALLGGAAASLPGFQGSNLQAQVEQQKTTGEAPLEHGRALAAAVPQAATESAMQLFVLGRGLGFGQKSLELLSTKTAAEQAAALARRASENLAVAAGKGVVRGVAAEVPVELSQQVLERWQARQDILGPDAMKDYEQTAVGTLGPAALLGGMGGAHGRRAAKQQQEEQQRAVAEAARKKDLEAEEAKKKDPATLAAHQQDIDTLAARAAKINEMLTSGSLAGKDGKGIRKAAKKELESINGQIKVLHGALKEAGVDVPDAAPDVSVKDKAVDIDAALAEHEQRVAQGQTEAQLREKAKTEKAGASADKLIDQRFGPAEKEGLGLDAHLRRMEAQRLAEEAKQAAEREYVVDDYGNRTRRKVEDATGVMQGDDTGANLYEPTMDAFGREIPGLAPPALRSTRYEEGWEKFPESAHPKLEEWLAKQKADMEARGGAETAAARAEALLKYAPLEFRGPGKDPLEPAKRREVLTNIDSGIIDRDVQNALGLSKLSRTHELDTPADADKALPLIRARIKELQEKRDALFDPKVELTNPDGTFTAAGANAVADEMRLSELRRLEKRAVENQAPDVGDQLITSFLTAHTANESPSAGLIKKGEEVSNQSSMRRHKRKQEDAFSSLRETLDEIREGRYIGGSKPEAAAATRDILLKRAHGLKRAIISSALREAAHARALNKLNDVTKDQAIRTGMELQKELDDLIERATVQREKITEPAQMRGTEIVTPAREYYGYPGVRPFGRGEYEALVGRDQMAEEGGFKSGATKEGDFWTAGAPRDLSKAPGKLRGREVKYGGVQARLQAIKDKLAQPRDGAPILRKKEIHGQFATEEERKHDAATKHLPEYRQYVADQIDAEMERNPAPEVAKLLDQALDVLAANRGTREFVENVEHFLYGLRRGYADPQLQDQLARDIATDIKERGSESPALVGKKEREETVAEKQPDLFDAEPRVNVSIRQAEEELAEKDKALEQFKGRKLDLQGMKAWRAAIAERDNVETRLMILRNVQEAEGGSGFVDKGTDIAAGATTQSTAKKFMKFLNSAGVKALKDFYSPGWRALRKQQAVDDGWHEKKKRVAEIDAQLDKLADDPRFKPLKDVGAPVLTEAATPQEVQANMQAFREWIDANRALAAQRKAYDAAVAPLVAERKKLLPVQQGGQEKGRPAHTAVKAATETKQVEAATVLRAAYDESEALYQSLRNVQDDKEIQQARAVAADLREEVRALRKDEVRHWAGSEHLTEEVAKLDAMAKEYEDKAEALEKARRGDFDAAMVRANALATKEVQAQRMALERQEKMLEQATGLVEKQLRVPVPIVREMDDEALSDIRKSPEYKKELRDARAAVVMANKALKADPQNAELQAALARAKQNVQAVEVGKTNVLGYGETYVAEALASEKNEIQKQRAALAAAERAAEAKRDELSKAAAALAQRKAEALGQKVTTVKRELVEAKEDYEYGDTGKTNRKIVRAVRKDKKLETRAELNEQRNELRDELAAAKPGTEEHRDLTRKIIKLTNRLKNVRGEVAVPQEQRVTSVQYPKETPVDETKEERVARMREEGRNRKAAEELRREKRFGFENAPAAETNAANAAAAKALKFKGDLPGRVNPAPLLRTGIPKEATALTKKQREAQEAVQRDIDAAKKGKVDFEGEDRASRGANAEPTGNTAARVVTALKAKFNAPAFDRLTTVVQSEGDLPAAIRNNPEYREGTRGVAHNGRVYLVADNIAPGKEMGVFLHEAGAHLGFDKILSANDRLWLRKQIEGWAKQDDATGKLAREALEQGGKSDDEVIAYMAEKLVDAGVTPQTEGKAGGWLRRVYQAFKKALDSLLGRGAQFSPQDLVDMAFGAAQQELSPAPAKAPEKSTRFSATYAPDYDPALIDVQNRIIAQDKTLRQKLTNFVAGLHQNVVDAQGPFHDTLRKAVNTGALSAKSAMQASYFVREMQRTYNWVSLALSDGVPKIVVNKDGDHVIRGTGEASAKKIINALQPLVGPLGNSTAVLRAYSTWRAAKRAEIVGIEKLNFGVDEKGRPNVTQADLDKALADGNSRPEFLEASRLHDEYNKALVDFAVAAHVFSKEEGDRLNAQKYYIPYYREDGNHNLGVYIDNGKPIKLGNIKNSPYLHELVGGETKILSFEDSIQQNTSLLAGMALQNMAARSAAFELQKIGLAYVVNGNEAGPNVTHFRVEPTGPNDDGKRSAMVGDGANNQQAKQLEKQLSHIPAGSRAHEVVSGKLSRLRATSGQFSGVSGELLVKSMEGVSTSIPLGMRLLAAPANILRKGVTRNPIYAVRQMIRDPFAAWMSTGADINPFTASFKEVYKLFSGRKEDYVEAQRRGVIGGQVFNGDPDDVKKLMKLHLDSGGKWSLWSTLDEMAIRSDGATRVALMKSFEKQGLSELEATMATNASMDFTRRGASATVHMASMMIPFFNAQIQGLDVAYKALSGNMTVGEKVQAYNKLWKRGALLAGMTIMYVSMMQDDEAYKNADPLTRLNNFFIRVPGLKEPLKVPIPFEFGFMFKSIPETMLLAASKDYKAEALLKGVGRAVVNMSPGGNLLYGPQAVKPVVEAYSNKVAYSGMPIASEQLQRLAPEYRASARTTELAKVIGGMTGQIPGAGEYLSPVMLDHFINGYLGGIGTNAAALASMVMPWGLVRSEVHGPVTKKMSELPIVGAAFQPVVGMGLVSQAYEMAKKAEEAKTTYDRLVQTNPEEAKRYGAAHREDIAKAGQARSFKEFESQQNKLEDLVRNAPKGKMTPDEKARIIENIKRAKIERAKRYLNAAG